VALQTKVEIPPFLFGQPKEESARIILSDDYEGIITRDYGFIIAIVEVLDVGQGIIIPGNASTFHKVVELVDFGSFIRLGPLDGLVHVSQICDDYISFEQVGNRFIGKETGKILEVNNDVRAKIIAVSLGTGRSGKLGLTMRQKEAKNKKPLEEEVSEE